MEKIFFFLLYLISFQLEASGFSYKYAWGDFTQINNTPQTEGFIMENEHNITLDSNSHTILNKSSITFNFSNTAVRPSLAENKPFCLGMKISYNGNQTGSVSFTSRGEGQITSRIDPSKDLNVFINHTANDALSVFFYSEVEFIVSMQFDNFKIYGGDLESFTIGDSESTMVLKGLGLLVGDPMNDTWLHNYFQTVKPMGATVPEPGLSILTLLGIAPFILKQ